MGRVGGPNERRPKPMRRRPGPRCKLQPGWVDLLFKVAVRGEVSVADLPDKTVRALVARRLLAEATGPGMWAAVRVSDVGLDRLSGYRGDPLGELNTEQTRAWYRRLDGQPLLDELRDTIAALRKDAKKRPDGCAESDADAIQRVLRAVERGQYAAAYRAARAADTGARECLPEALYDVLCEMSTVEQSDELPDAVWRRFRAPQVEQCIGELESKLATLRAEQEKLRKPVRA